MIIAIAAAALLKAQTGAPAEPAKGRALAQAYCAGCNAVGPTGASPRSSAPPFRQLHTRYPVESLQEALAEGIMTGHTQMPEFVFFSGDIDHFVAYLKSLENRPSSGLQPLAEGAP